MIDPFQMAYGPRIRFGQGESAFVGEEAQAYGMSRPMVLSDRGIAGSGVLTPILESIQKAGLHPHLYDQVEANPSDESILRAGSFYQENECDGLIAVGGGSTMDTAKAAGVNVTHPGSLPDYYGAGKVQVAIPPLITVPTTAGTGSEVTQSAIISISDQKIKGVMASPLMFARVAVVDPGLLAGMPAPIAAGTLMDALTHSIESLTSPRANPWTQTLCLEAIWNIGQNARRFVADPSDPESAAPISLASTWAGYCFTNTGLGIVHSLSHPIGFYHAVHHGTSNAIFLPPVMGFNLQAVRQLYSQIAPLVQHPDDSEHVDPENEAAPQAAIDAIRRLVKDIGIPLTLREAGVSGKENFEVMAKDAAVSRQVETNPVHASEADMLALFRAAFD
jgi:alcohol dehydrogenase class IV